MFACDDKLTAIFPLNIINHLRPFIVVSNPSVYVLSRTLINLLNKTLLERFLDDCSVDNYGACSLIFQFLYQKFNNS
jgi:hypothetical protein